MGCQATKYARKAKPTDAEVRLALIGACRVKVGLQLVDLPAQNVPERFDFGQLLLDLAMVAAMTERPFRRVRRQAERAVVTPEIDLTRDERV